MIRSFVDMIGNLRCKSHEIMVLNECFVHLTTATGNEQSILSADYVFCYSLLWCVLGRGGGGGGKYSPSGPPNFGIFISRKTLSNSSCSLDGIFFCGTSLMEITVYVQKKNGVAEAKKQRINKIKVNT